MRNAIAAGLPHTHGLESKRCGRVCRVTNLGRSRVSTLLHVIVRKKAGAKGAAKAEPGICNLSIWLTTSNDVRALLWSSRGKECGVSESERRAQDGAGRDIAYLTALLACGNTKLRGRSTWQLAKNARPLIPGGNEQTQGDHKNPPSQESSCPNVGGNPRRSSLPIERLQGV